ncbi:hypothetical protein J7643_19520 [bacterium]|nr:hypothetical protein [bacterium]
MANSDEPKTRFDLVSPGVGRVSGGLVTLVLGLGVLGLGFGLGNEFLRQAGITMTLMALFLMGYGAFKIFTGVGAKTRQIKCPSCGEVNQILQQVTSFPCFNCEKPLKLGAKKP